MRYFAVIEYDGTRYGGWQIQPNAISIEEEIEKVLSKLLNTPTKIYGSGRTDAGVHAHGQTFHFDSKEITDLGKFRYSLNSLLPKDMFVKELTNKENVHARYDAKAKTYVYLINTGIYDPFNKDKMYQLLRKLDVTKMKEASKLFVGEHNFQNFTSKDEDQSNFVRNIYSLDIIEDKGIVKLTFVGNGFMRYMVRMIIGALIEVGLSRLEIVKLEEQLNQKERKVVSYKAPASGLYLEKVEY